MPEVAQLVSSVGFPIAAFFLIFWLVKGELGAVQKAMDENTKVLVELTTVIREHFRDP